MDKIRRQADGLLAELSRLNAEFKASAAQLNAEIESVKSAYKTEMERLADEIKLLEKELIALSKKNRKALFNSDPSKRLGAGKVDESIRLDLPHGALLYALERPVKRIKGMLAVLQKLGLSEAIKTNPSVNWDEIEKWDDEKLKAVGTGRKKKERFEFELI